MLTVGVQDEIIQKARVSEDQGFTVTAALADQAAVDLSKVPCLRCTSSRLYSLQLTVCCLAVSSGGSCGSWQSTVWCLKACCGSVLFVYKHT